MSSSVAAFDGCYEAPRAAALAGVPKSTVYDWARKGIVVPSISRTREMLWSYADLMSLRIVHWLRHPKEGVQASPMHEVRSALERLEDLRLDVWRSDGDEDQSPIVVDWRGRILLPDDPSYSDFVTSEGDRPLAGVLDLLGPFSSPAPDQIGEHPPGPSLIRPRPDLRIVPGKVSGEPHIAHTRVTTLSISSLAQRGFDLKQIHSMYPDQHLHVIKQGLDLEESLRLAA